MAYGGALLAHAYGFLAVFAAGLAVRQIEMRSSASADAPEDVRHAGAAEAHRMATHRATAPAYMTEAVLAFNEQIDRIGALGMVLLVGAMLSPAYLTRDVIWFVPLLLLVIRPASVWVGLCRSQTDRQQRHIIAWFGVRGIGSLYYLMFAIEHGLAPAQAERFVALTLAIIAVSVVVHGISVTPLMNRYETTKDAAMHVDQPHASMSSGWRRPRLRRAQP